MIAAIALVDLDDTLFQTVRKCPPGLPPHALTPMASDKSGAPISFATPVQAAWTDWLLSSALVVPVTGRSRDALSRVNLACDYAIAAHGGVVLRPGGVVCPDWSARMTQAAAAHRAELDRLAALCQQLAQDAGAGAEIGVRIIGEADTGLYVVAKHRDQTHGEPALHRLAAAAGQELPPGWVLHVNGNNVALLPPFLGKRQAAEFLLADLRALYPGRPVLGMGDSVTDAPFMQLCDFAVVPAQTQLAAAIWRGLDASA